MCHKTTISYLWHGCSASQFRSLSCQLLCLFFEFFSDGTLDLSRRDLSNLIHLFPVGFVVGYHRIRGSCVHFNTPDVRDLLFFVGPNASCFVPAFGSSLCCLVLPVRRRAVHRGIPPRKTMPMRAALLKPTIPPQR